MRPGQIERAATTTNATAPPACSRLSTWPAVTCWANFIVVIVPASFADFSIPSNATCPQNSRCTSSWTTTARKTQGIRRWLAKRPRFHLHFTPTSASWLNLVERWFAELTEKQIRRGIHRSTRELEHAIRGFIDHHNQHPKPFVWTKSADQILDSVARFCKRTLDSVH